MFKSSALDEIGLKHGTDKASSHHNYLEFYEFFFAPQRDKQLTVLEIGVLNGASLKTWEEYFPHAKIIGIDVVATSKRYERGRVTIELADQSNVEDLTSVAIKHGAFDIIIEDGSHMWNHQITTLRTLFPFVKNDGFYIVEDLQTNYGPLQSTFKGAASSTCVDFLKAWLDLRVADDQIPIDSVEDAFLRTYGRGVEFIAFYRRACLIKKRLSSMLRDVSEGRPLVTTDPGCRSSVVCVIAHVANIGDVVGRSGFVNLGLELQGIAIDSDDALEYRVRFPDGSWSNWTQKGGFAGTRGCAMALTGFTIRLLENANERHRLLAFGRFAGSDYPVKVSDGQDCASMSGEALCGIQVELAKRR